MKKIYIADKNQDFIHWNVYQYKIIKMSKHIFNNIFFLINSNKICAVSFYDKGLYTHFNIENKIRISTKCIEKYLSFLNEQ